MVTTEKKPDKETKKSSEADKQLDEMLLNVWELVNKIIQHQTLLESWMKGGYINIAKARYVMGQQSVGVSQLPSGDSDISARALVDKTTADQVGPQVAAPLQYRLVETAPPAGHEPLRWFSALPPGALRDAQRQFRRALELTCELATLKAQLIALLAKLDSRRAKVEGLAEAVQHLSVSAP